MVQRLSWSLASAPPYSEPHYVSGGSSQCLVKSEHPANGYEAHLQALLWACRKLFIEEDGEAIWHFDAGKADARQIPAEELFFLPEEWRTGKACRPDAGSPQVTDGGKRPYWQAFLLPPYGCSYTADDFRKVNAALFPDGTDRLEVYEWTTGWSEYFDEGREWWGTLCVTAYDPGTDRFAVILASATD